MTHAITQECWEQYWTSPGGNTPQDTSCTATSLPSWKLYKLDEPDTRDTAGEARTNSSVMYSYGPPHMAKQKQDDQLEYTYSSYVRIQDVALKTCQERWMIGRSGERGSGISVLVARHDDDMTHVPLQFPLNDPPRTQHHDSRAFALKLNFNFQHFILDGYPTNTILLDFSISFWHSSLAMWTYAKQSNIWIFDVSSFHLY